MRVPPSAASFCGRFWEWLIPPSVLFVAVMLGFPAFLFQKNLGVLALEAAAFFLLALSRRGKLRLLPSVLMVAGITFFALLAPHGQVLARVGSFAITKGAVEVGLSRGVTLAGMVFLSQLALSAEVRLPGKIGGFLVEMFQLLDVLAGERLEFGHGDGSEPGNRKKTGGMKGLFSALDRRLYQVYWQEKGGLEGAAEEKSAKESGRHNGGLAVRSVVAVVVWLGALYSLLVASVGGFL